MHKKNNNSLTKNFIQGLRPLANTLPQQIKKILKKNGFNLSSLVDNWTKIVGSEISNNCYPLNIKARGSTKEVTLILNVIHGKEIDIEYNKINIIDKINSYFGYSFIKNIQIKILNSKFSSLKNNTIIDKKRGNFDYNLKKIEDINLKNKLQNLINAFNEKNKYIFLILLFALTQIFVTTNSSGEALKIGNENAKITVKVFSSLTCPHCASFHKKIFES